MSLQWVCKPENYQSTLLLKDKAISFIFDLFTERGYTFRTTIPPLDLIEKIEIAALQDSDVEAVWISMGRLIIWEGSGQSVFEVNIPTQNNFLQLEVRYSKTCQVAPIFCWARVTMKYAELSIQMPESANSVTETEL